MKMIRRNLIIITAHAHSKILFAIISYYFMNYFVFTKTI
uniref:Uncharacterized protein n=1 Tax=Elizabethkingia anophelis TaxID=1117645 RepID=A0A455ZD08_9FLAO|nr:TPA_exp: hypothetical protein [Elizabethkingia anophelis]